jgi:hypothetical protein
MTTVHALLNETGAPRSHCGLRLRQDRHAWTKEIPLVTCAACNERMCGAGLAAPPKPRQLALPLAGAKQRRFAPPSKSSIVIEGMHINGHRLVLQDGGKEIERTCPSCHQRLPLAAFGLRLMGTGEIRVQAHCAVCRGGKA